MRGPLGCHKGAEKQQKKMKTLQEMENSQMNFFVPKEKGKTHKSNTDRFRRAPWWNVRHKACIRRAHHPGWEDPGNEVKSNREDSLHFSSFYILQVLLFYFCTQLNQYFLNWISIFWTESQGRVVWTKLSMLLALLGKNSTLVKEIWTRIC